VDFGRQVLKQPLVQMAAVVAVVEQVAVAELSVAVS
jgi:hypothetical protein